MSSIVSLSSQNSIPPMEVVEFEGGLVIDSRLVALDLDIQHKNLFESIKTYQFQIEQAFGIIAFETEEIKGRGQPQKFAWLTEDQATFLMSLSRNTDQVVRCKINLIKAFRDARKRLAEPETPKELIPLADQIAALGIEKLREMMTPQGFDKLVLNTSKTPLKTKPNTTAKSSNPSDLMLKVHALSLRLGTLTPRIVKKYRLVLNTQEAIDIFKKLEALGYGTMEKGRTFKYSAKTLLA